MRNTSIVVKTCRDDLPSYARLQRDLLRFGHTAVRVCALRAELAAFESIASPDFELVSAERLLYFFGWPWQLAENWYSQQLYKLLLVATCETEACWVLDSNTLLMKPLPDPWHDEQVTLALGVLHPFDTLCFEASARFLGLPPDGPAVDPVNQPLRASVVRSLLIWIQRIYGGRPLEALIRSMYAGRRRDAPYWTEYGLYRSFAFHVARAAHIYSDDLQRVAYYNHDREGPSLEEWLDSLTRTRPAMVKVYARRHSYRLDPGELDRLCDRIRECC